MCVCLCVSRCCDDSVTGYCCDLAVSCCAAVSAFLEFLYTDRVRMETLAMDVCMSLINMGAQHDLPRLVGLCEKFLVDSVDWEDVESTLAMLTYVLS
jgi:hypothetical protein